MDPVCGRFESEDPGKEGSNWFVYAVDNPINAIDATGRSADFQFWADLLKFFLRDADFSASITNFVRYMYAEYGQPGVDKFKSFFNKKTGEDLDANSDPDEVEYTAEEQGNVEEIIEAGRDGAEVDVDATEADEAL